MKVTAAIGLVVMVTIVMQLSPTMSRETVDVGGVKVSCDEKELLPCLLPIINPPEKPTADCCQTLKDHLSCMCGLIKNSWLGPTLISPKGHKLFADCQIPFPSC
ncbi:hypothetical protein N665_0157s0305 [Sinapis alba]|nr:hypothetical protein N665_0157s0305 [Sinapis alba]